MIKLADVERIKKAFGVEDRLVVSTQGFEFEVRLDDTLDRAWWAYHDGPETMLQVEDELDEVADLLDGAVKLIAPYWRNTVTRERLETALGGEYGDERCDEAVAALDKLRDAARRGHRPRGPGQHRDRALLAAVEVLAEYWLGLGGEFGPVGEWIKGQPKHKGQAADFIVQCIELITPEPRGLEKIVREQQRKSLAVIGSS